MHGQVHCIIHAHSQDLADREQFAWIKGIMPRPKAHYSLHLKNQVTGEELKVELIDLPFCDQRRFRLRVNGRWAKKLPCASKTAVVAQARTWLVRH